MSNYTIGCDISHHNNFIVDADFVIHKATEGISFVDNKFHANMQVYMGKDTILGSYHFARPDLGHTPQDEANHYINSISPYIGNMFLALDVEGKALSCKNLDKWCVDFMTYIRNKTKLTPFLYTSEGYAHLFPTTRKLFPLWCAKYSLKHKPKIPYLMWQITSNPFDIDIYNGDKEELKSWAIVGKR